jgi:hypothetical protein
VIEEKNEVTSAGKKLLNYLINKKRRKTNKRNERENK